MSPHPGDILAHAIAIINQEAIRIWRPAKSSRGVHVTYFALVTLLEVTPNE
ncbi:hypothetical protein OAA60_00740 [Porticoccaceae bacterium]|nr:hypothetical protein [Porticoccaceae bacterium]